MDIKEVKKYYLNLFFEYFNKKKIVEDPSFWYISEVSSTSITVRCGDIDGLTFRLSSDDKFDTYELRAEVTADGTFTKLDIKKFSFWNIIHYYKIINIITFLKKEKKRVKELSEIKHFMSRMPKKQQRALKIKSF